MTLAEPRSLELRIGELGQAEIERWGELGRRVADPNPFAEADFLLPAAELIAGAPDRLLVVADEARWIACLPLARTRIRGLTRANAGCLHSYGFLSTPLIAADGSHRASALLIEALAELEAYPLLLERLGASGPFFEALDRALAAGSVRALEREDYERALLTRDGARWSEHVGPHHARDLRRTGRRLTEQLGGELECSNRAGDPAAVERFIELELAGWKGRAGTAFGSDPSHAEFFRRICDRFHAGGRLELFELGGGGRVAAMKCNLTAGEGAFGFKIAFDEELGRWSPGIQLELRNMELFDQGERSWMDSCAVPDNAMINRLWPGRRPMCTLLLGSPGARGRASAASIALTRGLRSVKRAAARVRSRPGRGRD